MAEPQDLWGERARLRPRQLLYDVVVAGGFTLLAVAVALQQSLAMVAVTSLMGLALALRRVSWVVMAALAAACGVGQLAAGELAIFTDLGFTPVFFVLGAHPRLGVRRFGLAAALGAVVVLGVAVGAGGLYAVSGVSSAFEVVGSGALAALVAGGGWALGFVRWQSRARITAQVQAGLEQERTRMAADMHDLVAHTWAVVAAQADGARYSLGTPGGEQQAVAALDLIAETARSSIGDLRDLLAELRYAPGHDLVARMRASGMDLRMVQRGEPRDGGRWLLAETLTNALKHGDLAHPVEVEEDWRDGYRLVVRNRVRSAPSATSTGTGTGSGLAGLRERVERAGGSFSAGASGDTWTVTAVLP